MLRRAGAAAQQGARRLLNAINSPLELLSVEHRQFCTADDVTVVAGLATVWNDQTAFGNNGIVPAGVAGATAPLYEATGWNGLPSAVFNGVTDAIARSTFNWGAAGGSLTFWILAQRLDATSSRTFLGYQGTTPRLRTYDAAGASWSGAGAVGDLSTKSTYSPSLIVGRIDTTAGLQSLWIDGVKVSESPNASATSAMTGTVGVGYGGHPTTGAAFANARVRAWGVCRNAMSDSDIVLLHNWAVRQASPMLPNTVEVLGGGQSNCLARDCNVGTLTPRRDIGAERYNTILSGPTIFNEPWGAMDADFDVPNYKGWACDLMVKLKEVSRARAYLVMSAYTGIGFYTTTGVPDLWIPPSSNGGAPGAQYTQFVNTVRSARMRAPARSKSVLVWVHGETDALSPVGAPLYYTNLTNCISDLEVDLGLFDQVIVVRLSSSFDDGAAGARLAVVRAAQDAVVLDLGARGTLVDMDGWPMQPDNIHFSNAGHIHVADTVRPVVVALAA